jgi:Zn-dependent peptidase ImmA (M78 family)
MANLTDPERKKIVHSLALALVQHMGVDEPPVWVESLLKDPPTVYAQKFPLVRILHKVLEVIFVWSPEQGYQLLLPSDLPLVERRFILARELLTSLMRGLGEQAAGLSKVLLPDLENSVDYFARVFLAPDPMIEDYRKQGNKYTGFAETFLIPERVATKRWQDPIVPSTFSEERLHRHFSFS